MRFLQGINQWANDFQPLVQLVMLIAVSGATITALWSALKSRRDTRVQLEYYCDISAIHLPKERDSQGITHYEKSHLTVGATITNIGLRQASIPWLGFDMRIPLGKQGALLQPATDFRQDAPLALEPGQNLTLELRSPDQLREEILDFNIKWFARFRIRRLRLFLRTNGGDRFKARIGKDLKKHISAVAAETSWIHEGKNASEAEVKLNTESKT